MSQEASQKRFKGCIFDFDGTLADTMSLWVEVGRKFAVDNGFEPLDNFTDLMSDMGLVNGVTYLCQLHGLDYDPLEVLEGWKADVAVMYGKTSFKPGAIQVLRQLKEAGYKLAIATAGMHEPVNAALAFNGLTDMFDAIVTCGDAGAEGKSSPAVYLEAARQIGLEAGECLVFEDVASNIRVATAAMFWGVGVNDDQTDEVWEGIDAASDWTIHGFDCIGPELKEVLGLE